MYRFVSHFFSFHHTVFFAIMWDLGKTFVFSIGRHVANFYPYDGSEGISGIEVFGGRVKDILVLYPIYYPIMGSQILPFLLSYRLSLSLSLSFSQSTRNLGCETPVAIPLVFFRIATSKKVPRIGRL